MNTVYSKMNIWQDKPLYDRVEKLYYEMLVKVSAYPNVTYMLTCF